MRRAAGLLLLVAAVVGITCACARRPEPARAYPERPLIARRFYPPANYRGWYESAEKCVGLKGDFDGVTWIVSPTPWGDTTYAEWWVVRDSLGFPKRVEITVNAAMWLDSTLIIHESIHDILWRNGWAPPPAKSKLSKGAETLRHHPQPPFGRCAPVFYPWPAEWTAQSAYRP